MFSTIRTKNQITKIWYMPGLNFMMSSITFPARYGMLALSAAETTLKPISVKTASRCGRRDFTIIFHPSIKFSFLSFATGVYKYIITHPKKQKTRYLFSRIFLGCVPVVSFFLLFFA